MEIRQFYDKPLAHASYAIVSGSEMAVIDPARNPQPYYDFAKEKNTKIVAVIESHPHADFVSSHLEIYNKTGANIYVSRLVGAEYPHKTFDDGDIIHLGKITLKAVNTPGHSPDSISIIAEDDQGQQQAVFTGDTLFVGDVGRPDLRENVGNVKAQRKELAQDMYRSLRNKLLPLNEEVLVYPAHGAGSLCGKNMGSDTYSTIGREKRENWALQNMSEEEFVNELLNDQPFIPKYFGHDVDINKAGAGNLKESLEAVPYLDSVDNISGGTLIVDTRDQNDFRQGHINGAINIVASDRDKFETWLGSIIGPEEEFYLLGSSAEGLEKALERTAKIGYEKNVKGMMIVKGNLPEQALTLDIDKFKNNEDDYTIVDVRNKGEVEAGKIFTNALTIPLHELRERAEEIPLGKPIVVHCAAGYRSAAAASILEGKFHDTKIYDMGADIRQFS